MILTGLTVDSCALFTASDADLRDDHLIVPEEGVVVVDPRHSRQALEHMRRVLKAEVMASTALSLTSRAA